jgi:hypothetical protein
MDSKEIKTALFTSFLSITGMFIYARIEQLYQKLTTKSNKKKKGKGKK